jgi:hypothetical protein
LLGALKLERKRVIEIVVTESKGVRRKGAALDISSALVQFMQGWPCPIGLLLLQSKRRKANPAVSCSLYKQLIAQVLDTMYVVKACLSGLDGKGPKAKSES